MKRFYCDSCEVEITPINRASKDFQLTHTAPDTGHNFSLKVLWGNDASGHGRVVFGDGDLCTVCLINMIYEASIEAQREQIDKMREEAEEADEAFNSQFSSILGDDEDEEENFGDDIDLETGEAELEDENDFSTI